MSLHKLSAGGGVTYLLRHTCCGDVERAAETPLSAYYTASGYPPGRWLGAGLPGLGGGAGVSGLIDETGMERLFSLGLDPATQAPLGKASALHKTANQRIAALPTEVGRRGITGKLRRFHRAAGRGPRVCEYGAYAWLGVRTFSLKRPPQGGLRHLVTPAPRSGTSRLTVLAGLAGGDAR